MNGLFEERVATLDSVDCVEFLTGEIEDLGAGHAATLLEQHFPLVAERSRDCGDSRLVVTDRLRASAGASIEPSADERRRPQPPSAVQEHDDLAEGEQRGGRV